MRSWRVRLPLWWVRLSLLGYCLVIFFISSRSRPEEELGLPTGAVMHFIEYAGLGVLAWLNAGRHRREPGGPTKAGEAGALPHQERRPDDPRHPLMSPDVTPTNSVSHPRNGRSAEFVSCPRNSRRWKALAFAAFYAMTDEVHQAYVPLRSCQLEDWLVDVLGALVGILVMERLVATGRLRLRITRW